MQSKKYFVASEFRLRLCLPYAYFFGFFSLGTLIKFMLIKKKECSVYVFVMERMAIVYSLKWSVLFSFVVLLAVTHCHSFSFVVTLSNSLSLFLIRCHSLSLAVTRCTTRCHSLYHSLVFVVTRCTTRRHLLSFVVTRCTTRCTHCHSLSLVVTRCTTCLSFYKRSK